MAVEIGMLHILQFALSVVLGLVRFIVQSIVHMPSLNALYFGVLGYILWCVYFATNFLISELTEKATQTMLFSDIVDLRSVVIYSAVICLGLKLLRVA